MIVVPVSMELKPGIEKGVIKKDSLSGLIVEATSAGKFCLGNEIISWIVK